MAVIRHLLRAETRRGKVTASASAWPIPATRPFRRWIRGLVVLVLSSLVAASSSSTQTDQQVVRWKQKV